MHEITATLLMAHPTIAHLAISHLATDPGALYLVIVLNCFIVLLVIAATCGLWIGKQQLRQVSDWLHAVELNPQQMRYAIALQRVQLAEHRLGVVTWQNRWQMRSRQFRQIMQLVQLVRIIMLIQSGRYRIR